MPQRGRRRGSNYLVLCFVIFRSGSKTAISERITQTWTLATYRKKSPSDGKIYRQKKGACGSIRPRKKKLGGRKSMGLCKSISCSNKRAMICLLFRSKGIKIRHWKYLPLRISSAVFNKKVRLDIKQEGLRAQQHDAKIAASNAMLELVESFKNKPAPDNMDELKVNAAKAVAKAISEYKKKSKKEKFLAKTN